jgi:uncharacterized protein (DUF58 family)
MRRCYHLHLPGLIYIALTLLVGYAAIASQRNLLFWVFGVMTAALLISGIVSGAMLMGLELRRLDPRHGAVGEPLFLRYAVHNRNRLVPVFNIHIEERPLAAGGWNRIMAPARAWVMHVAADETVHGEAVAWPARRGQAAFHAVRAWTTFPFGIIRKSVTFSQPQHTLIYPRLYELRPRLLARLTPQGSLGMRITQHAGGGDDYFGMREYRPGDSLRAVSWKRSARLDDLVTIERTRPSPPRLRIVLNLLTPTNRLRITPADPAAQREAEERAISLAASLIHEADIAGFEVGLTVLGLDVPVIPIRRSHWHVGRLLAALAGLDLDRPRDHRPAAPDDVERAAVVVVHPDRVDPGIGRSEAWHLTAGQLESLAVRPIGWSRLAGAAAADAAARPGADDDPAAPAPHRSARPLTTIEGA